MKIAIFSVDPGTTSGVARGIVRTAKGHTAWDCLKVSEIESWEVEGSPPEQAWEIMGEYEDWSKEVQSSWKPGARIELVLTCESFQIRVGKGASSRKDLLDPVRVASGMEALSYNRAGECWAPIIYQSPSSAKTYATNERLRRADIWVKGSDHRRDAVRHLSLAFSRRMK